MNQRERKLLARIYTVVIGLDGLRARNPADIKTISSYHAEIPRIMRPLGFAISSMGFGDLTECAEYMDDAEKELATARNHA